MRIISGCIGASTGTVLLDGESIQKNPIQSKRRIGYLPEIPPLYPNMTVENYLLFAAKIKGSPNPVEAVEKTIISVGLQAVRHRFIEPLSKGYKQRVGIAQALIHDPDLLILDEPTSSMDTATEKIVLDNLSSWMKNKTLIAITHRNTLVKLASRVMVIDRGLLVADDTPEKLMQSSNN